MNGGIARGDTLFTSSTSSGALSVRLPALPGLLTKTDFDDDDDDDDADCKEVCRMV